MRFRIAVMTATYPPAYWAGGPVRSMEAAALTASDQVEPHVFTTWFGPVKGLEHEAAPDVWSVRDGVAVYRARATGPSSLRMWATLVRGRYDAIFCQSYWNPRFTQGVLVLKRLGLLRGVSVFVAPSGEFFPEALARHARRKRVLRALSMAAGLYRGVTWKASSDDEKEAIRRTVGARARILLHEDDTTMPDGDPRSDPPADGVPRIGFIGRLTEFKGLHVAVEAVGRAGVFRKLDVYGPEEEPGYLHRCVTLGKMHHVDVRYHGSLEPHEVNGALRELDLLLVPSHSESFGNVIAEGLQAGAAVMVTPMTPWSERIRSAGAGYVVARVVDDWVAALSDYRALAPEARAHMSRNATMAFNRWRRQRAASPSLLDAITGHIRQTARPPDSSR